MAAKSPITPIADLELPHYLRPPVPSVFTFEITTRCRHHCVGCGNIFSHSHKELDVKNWVAILEKVRPYVKALRITGGEPTLHKQFSELLAVIDSVGVPFVVFSNAHWSNPQATLNTLRRCSNLSGLLISLHGRDRDAYRAFTGVDAFQPVVANLTSAAASGLRVATNTLLLTTTCDYISEISELALSAGASTASFGRYYGAPLKGLSLSPKLLKQALSQIAALRRDDKRIRLSNCVPECFGPEEDFGGGGCTSGFTHCTIGPFGDVRPCTHSRQVLGHLPLSDIASIWRSEKLSQWRELIPNECRSCKALNTCRGGCRAVAQELGTSGDPLYTSTHVVPDRDVVVELGLDDRLRLAASLLEMPFGYGLSGAGQYVTLSHKSGPILQKFDGSTTIEQIMDEFGEVAVELIGSLLQKHLVELC